MTTIGQPERATQKRVIDLFRDELGYRYLGDWTDQDGNSNLEEGVDHELVGNGSVSWLW
jgi:type I restriction enzyme R subunit